ncbi:gliding motility lipoprotein GldB [Lutibacter holmesii]|uniref:Gliding motility lipoprotein GldB n=1 Tax=Lutibacter holmesii TaxID=1137985 RepID=A0ABW3WQU3_9FLAO
MNKIISVLLILLMVISCKSEIKNQVDVSEIEVDVNIERFEQHFYTTTKETLPNIKESFPFLFPLQYADSIWLHRINDPKEVELFEKTEQVFGNFETQKNEIEDVFKHVKYYHPLFEAPKVITLITNLDFENKVMYTNDYLFISLDMYLGANDEVYKDFPLYLAHNFTTSQLSVDIGKAISERFYSAKSSRQFIDLIVNEGKKMYLLDCYVPLKTDAQKMGYSTDKMDWVLANEEPIWKYFIENKLLFSTDADLYTRFVADAPFSKFYIDIDNESPGKIGVWLGWQIVRSYMNNNNVTLQQLLQTNAEEIFKKSKYKPNK